MAQPPTTEMSDFEKQRLANIAERDALLKQLTLDAQSAVFTKASTPKANGSSKKRPAPKRVAVKNETLVPRRTSSRLAGITADGEVAKRKADQEYEAAQDHARAKRQRISGDLGLGDILVAGNGTKGFLGDLEGMTKGIARPYERTFGDEEVKATGDKELKAMREKMCGLALWEPWEPNRIKITPERIYSMAMHPTTNKPLIFAGDKLGNLGLFDASQTPSEVKQEDDEDEDDGPDPVITTLKPHTRTICAMRTHNSTPQTLYTASYDSSIRALDLEKSVSTELYAAPDEDALSGIDMAPTDPNVVYFTTLSGLFGRHDIRTGSTGAANDSLYQLSEKKIGGFSLHPLAPHYISTASLDRFMRVWDLRMVKAKMPQLVGEHTSRLSVSHAAFNSAGQVATSSYDDSVKIYDFKGMENWKKGENVYDGEIEPDVVVRHNCQTGRWVTILRPQWQATPRDGVQRLCIGHMNRFVNVYSAKGEQLAQLGGEGITAVPAVAMFHPTENWVAGGTASGKLCLWM